MFHAIDDENVARTPSRLKPRSKLLLHGRKDRSLELLRRPAATAVALQASSCPRIDDEYRVVRQTINDYNVVYVADVVGAFEQAVLLAVLRLGDEAYGRAILKEVQERLEKRTAAGAVHATLVRLEGKGLLASRLGDGTEIRAGRPRRFYTLRPAGRRALNDARAHVNRLWSGIKWPLKGTA